MENYKESDDQWDAFSLSLLPISSLFGNSPNTIGHKLNKIIVSLAMKQADVLLFGLVNGTNSPNLKKLSGIPYLSGDDTWIDLPRMFGLPLLQPDKIHFRENNDPDWIYVIPLLKEMENLFSPIAANIRELLLEAEDSYRIRITERTQLKSDGEKNRKINTKNVSYENREDEINFHEKKKILENNCDSNQNGNFMKILSFIGIKNSNFDCTSSSPASASTSSASTSTSFTSTSSSMPSTFFNPSQFNIVDDDYIVINEAGLDIIRELNDCIQLLLLRATHVRLLYESRDKPKPTPAARTGLQKAARDLLSEATKIGEMMRRVDADKGERKG